MASRWGKESFFRKAFKKHVGLKYGSSSKLMEREARKAACAAISLCSASYVQFLERGEMPEWLDQAHLHFLTYDLQQAWKPSDQPRPADPRKAEDPKQKRKRSRFAIAFDYWMWLEKDQIAAEATQWREKLRYI